MVGRSIRTAALPATAAFRAGPTLTLSITGRTWTRRATPACSRRPSGRSARPAWTRPGTRWWATTTCSPRARWRPRRRSTPWPPARAASCSSTRRWPSRGRTSVSLRRRWRGYWRMGCPAAPRTLRPTRAVACCVHRSCSPACAPRVESAAQGRFSATRSTSGRTCARSCSTRCGATRGPGASCPPTSSRGSEVSSRARVSAGSSCSPTRRSSPSRRRSRRWRCSTRIHT